MASSVPGLSLHYPVALKLLSRDASHKSDVGGVKINIRTKQGLMRSRGGHGNGHGESEPAACH